MNRIILICTLSILIFSVLFVVRVSSEGIEQELFLRNNLVVEQTYKAFATVWDMFEKSRELTLDGQSFGTGESLARLLTGMCYTWLADYEITGNTKQITRVNWLLFTISQPQYHEKYAYHWSSMWIHGGIAYMRMSAADILTDETKASIDKMLILECDRMIEILEHIKADPLAPVDMRYWVSYGGHKSAVAGRQRISLLGATDNSWTDDTKAEETAGRARLLAICGNLYKKDEYIQGAKVFASVTFAHKQDIYGANITNAGSDSVIYNHGYGPNYAYAVAALYGIAEAHFSFIMTGESTPIECRYEQHSDVYARNVTDILMPDGYNIDLSLLHGNQKNIEYEHRPDIKWLAGDARYSLAVLPYNMLVNGTSIDDIQKIVDCLVNDSTWIPYDTESLLKQLADGNGHLAINHMIHNVEHYSQITYKWIIVQRVIRRRALLNALNKWSDCLGIVKHNKLMNFLGAENDRHD